MEYYKNRPKLRIKCLANSRGETLVETVVSFLVLIIALAAMTTMIVTANNMNEKSQERSKQIESDALAAEAGDLSGTYEPTEMEITITNDGSQRTYKIPLKVKKSGSFIYFGANTGTE